MALISILPWMGLATLGAEYDFTFTMLTGF
jgi:hypothetical protein